MSLFDKFRTNDTPYTEFKDNEEDLVGAASDSFVLRQTTKSDSSNPRSRPPRPFTVNRQQHRYQQLQQDYDEIEVESDQESNEAPASLIIETPSENNNMYNNNRSAPKPGMNIKELTMWKWVNVDNLDIFLDQVIILIIFILQ